MKFHSFHEPTGSVRKKVTKVMGVVSFHTAEVQILLASSFCSSGTKVCQIFLPFFSWRCHNSRGCEHLECHQNCKFWKWIPSQQVNTKLSFFIRPNPNKLVECNDVIVESDVEMARDWKGVHFVELRWWGAKILLWMNTRCVWARIAKKNAETEAPQCGVQ